MSAADIVSRYGTVLERSNDDASICTRDLLTSAQARALVAELRAAGHEASDCHDQDEPSKSWVYVTVET